MDVEPKGDKVEHKRGRGWLEEGGKGGCRVM